MNLMSAGLPDDQSPDAQLQLALQLVQQSYTRRQEELTREVEHWKRVAQHHKQQEAQTRDELNKSNQRGQELQQQLNQRNQEVQQLTESRNVALNQIATLKKHAAQLQSFKKNISNMITSESGIDSLSGMQAMVNDLPTMDTTFTSTMTSPALDAFNPRAGYFNANADYAAPSLSTGIAPAPMMSSYAPPAAGTSAAPPSTGISAPPAAPEVTLDAATYYQQVKRVLEPEQFREFSANIKKLNSGQQSVDETLDRVREIFGEHRPFLFAQLQKLIRQAEEEARRQGGEGE
jgi:ABC-type transporter Mla subunit MlaD